MWDVWFSALVPIRAVGTGLVTAIAAGNRDTARTRHGPVNCSVIIQAGQQEKWALQVLQRLGFAAGMVGDAQGCR